MLDINPCLIVYKQLQGDVPVYLNNLVKLKSNVHSRQTRYCNFNLTTLKGEEEYDHDMQSVE